MQQNLNLYLCSPFSIYRFDIDGNTFSPPAHEDQFFYIRYPNSENKTDNQSGVKSLTEALKDLNTNPATTAATSSSSIIQKDFSKQHTDSCKKYLNKVEKGEFIFHISLLLPICQFDSSEQISQIIFRFILFTNR